jgi:hypothetical protein
LTDENNKLTFWRKNKINLDDPELQRLMNIAFTPVFYTDKNGNLWLMFPKHSVLVKRKKEKDVF